MSKTAKGAKASGISICTFIIVITSLQAGIEIINLGEHNTGKYITQKPKEGEPLMVGAPGIFEFVIKVDKYPNGEMPKIKLVNKRMNDKEGKELIITLKKCCCNKTTTASH